MTKLPDYQTDPRNFQFSDKYHSLYNKEKFEPRFFGSLMSVGFSPGVNTAKLLNWIYCDFRGIFVNQKFLLTKNVKKLIAIDGQFGQFSQKLQKWPHYEFNIFFDS